jgi:hypothetical protein
MKISVALPTYNGAKYLQSQLESIRSQTRPPDELVITDDASSDDTLAIAESFARNASFAVSIFRNVNRLGCNDNFAEAISKCTGDVIALSDQDDVWKPRHLERLLLPFEHEDVSLVMANSEFVNENLQPRGKTLWDAFRFNEADARRLNRGSSLREWLKHHATAGHASAFRAELVPVILPFPKSMYDQWIGLVCSACGRVEMVNEILTLHRQHDAQTIGIRSVTLVKKASKELTVSQAHFDEQIEELQQLIARLALHSARVRMPDHEAIVSERISLFRERQALRQGGWGRRIVMSTRLLITGRYHRIGRGLLTYARDLRG